MERESFIFYQSFWKATKSLPEDNQKNALIMIIQYGIDGIEPSQEKDGIAYAIFLMAKPQIDASSDRWSICKSQGYHGIEGKEYGKLGGRPRKNPLKPPRGLKHNPLNVNVNHNVNDNVNDNNKQKKYFSDSKINSSFLDFIEMRKQKNNKPTERAIELLIQKLNKYNDNVKLEMLEEATMRGRSGIFEPQPPQPKPLKKPPGTEGAYQHKQPYNTVSKEILTLADV